MRASSFYYPEHTIFTFAHKSQGAGQKDYCPLAAWDLNHKCEYAGERGQ